MSPRCCTGLTFCQRLTLHPHLTARSLSMLSHPHSRISTNKYSHLNHNRRCPVSCASVNSYRFCHSHPANSIISKVIFSDSNKKCVHQALKNKVWGLLAPPDIDVESSAVLLPLCTVKGVPSIILTQRSTKLARSRGQVSFPGGKSDSSDSDVIHTALREAWEEIGLVPRSVNVWTQMAPSPFPLFGAKQDSRGAQTSGPQHSGSRLTLTPVVGYCGEVDMDRLTINTDEVSSVFVRSIASLCDPAMNGYTQFRRGSQGFKLPTYLGEPQRIWGATAIMLHHLLTALVPEHYKLSIQQSRKRKGSKK